MEIKEILLLVCIVGGFFVLTFSIKQTCKKYIAGNVVCQWISLVANIALMGNITGFLNKLFVKTAETKHLIFTLIVAVIILVIRYSCTLMSNKMSYLSSKAVKKKLREMIYKKCCDLAHPITNR